MIANHGDIEAILEQVAGMKEGDATLISGSNQFLVRRNGWLVQILDPPQPEVTKLTTTSYPPDVLIRPEETRPPSTTERFLERLLDGFKFVLSRRTRERVFEPAYQDLLLSFAESQQGKYQTKWVQRWAWGAFQFRAFMLVLRCLRTVWGSVGIAAAGYFLPKVIRHMWTEIFR